jgi:hypothetical protein
VAAFRQSGMGLFEIMMNTTAKRVDDCSCDTMDMKRFLLRTSMRGDSLVAFDLVSAVWCFVLFLGPFHQWACAADPAGSLPATQGTVDFRRDIEPILRDRCQGCHGSAQQQGGLRLDSRAAVVAGGYSGQVIKVGSSGSSKLIRLLEGREKGVVMPLTGERLTSEQIGLFRAWIDQGAVWPEETSALKIATSAEKTHPPSNHWAFIPPRRPSLPQARDSTWARNPIDAFILSKLDTEKITPSPEADRSTLIRRLSLDLIGLPPSPAEIADYLRDTRPDAYERVVDRLLGSPHYGEKWARHWLDLARYGDSDGYETDAPRPHAWRYRHWVIEAMNHNMPFDQFTIEQIAGDLLTNSTLEQKVATGFQRNTLTNREGGMDSEMLRVEQVVDRTNTIGTVWLGLTIGCATCHDHKYDPISQKEYYQLFAFLNSAAEVDLEAPLPGEIEPYLRLKPEYDRKRRKLLSEYGVAEIQAEWEKKTLEAATNPSVGENWVLAWHYLEIFLPGGHDILRISPTERTQGQQDQLTDHFLEWCGLGISEERIKSAKVKELSEKLEALKEDYPALSQAQTILENPAAPQSHLLIRGDYRQLGTEVEPRTPAALPGLPDGPFNRLGLARWLVSAENPLTSRVIVNRIWQELFGRGLVESSENFGTRGDLPTHPDLLDWLATEFIANGWDIKKIQRWIVCSATYRQSSKAREDLESADPRNRLLARQSRIRLSAELIRDSTLAASGLLNSAIGGKSVYPPQPAGVGELAYKNQWKQSKGADLYRRGLYIHFKRTAPYPQLITFDAPNSLTTCSRRERSTTPLQALTLLNDPVFFEAAQALAVRVLREEQGSLDSRIDYAFRLCLGHDPIQRDKDRLEQYYFQERNELEHDPTLAEVLPKDSGAAAADRFEKAAWVGLSSVLLNLDEFITRD